MIILEKPYVSQFLKNTITENKIRVIKTELSTQLFPEANELFISEKDAIAYIKNNPSELIYTNSENSISWIEKNLDFLELPQKIKLFKNKVKFRDTLKPIFPDYFFKSVPFNELENFDVEEIPFPIIIKPAIGFFSMGVRKIETKEEWLPIISEIKTEIEKTKNLYPIEVMNSSDFILEACIDGEEYAIDCYFDENSKPVIMNILHHIFSSGKDMSDRIYMTSANIVQENFDKMQAFLTKMGELTQVKNFPTHVEVRVEKSTGRVIPIEANPMRFGGWCSTPDLGKYSLGISIIEYFFKKKRPDWNNIFKGRENKVYSIVILDNSTGHKNDEIEKFDYDKLAKDFSKPLELRKINFHEYPVFGFVFCENDADNMNEIQEILKSDLKKYIVLKKK